MNKIEVLVDGLARLTDFDNPESLLYRYRNPIGLRVYCRHGKGQDRCVVCPPGHPLFSRDCRSMDWDHQNWLRRFGSVLDGYQASFFDVKVKLTGMSVVKFESETPTLIDLCIAYSLSGSRPAATVAKFLRRALSDDRIQDRTPLTYFLE